MAWKGRLQMSGNAYQIMCLACGEIYNADCGHRCVLKSDKAVGSLVDNIFSLRSEVERLAAENASLKASVCQWKYDEADGAYTCLNCGLCWRIEDGSLAENDCKFCPGCGRFIVLAEAARRCQEGWREMSKVEIVGGVPGHAQVVIELQPELNRVNAENLRLIAVLRQISVVIDCWGPGCWYCDMDHPHPHSREAMMARHALRLDTPA